MWYARFGTEILNRRSEQWGWVGASMWLFVQSSHQGKTSHSSDKENREILVFSRSDCTEEILLISCQAGNLGGKFLASRTRVVCLNTCQANLALQRRQKTKLTGSESYNEHTMVQIWRTAPKWWMWYATPIPLKRRDLGEPNNETLLDSNTNLLQKTM